MDITYRGIPLDIVDTEGTYRKAAFTDDRTTYLYTFWHIECLITMNEATATAVTLNLPGPSELPQSFIDGVIRHPLMQPRGQLILAMNGVPFLISPWPGDLTDAANGPFPISFDVLKFIGDKTFLCKYVIEARVNECRPPGAIGSYNPAALGGGGAYVPFKGEAYTPLGPNGAINPGNFGALAGAADIRPPVLAQRWYEIADTDDDYFTTRTVVGRVVFRSDALIRQQLTPDFFRSALRHPIPANMKRDNIRVEQESDGITYTYTFMDHEKPFNWRPNDNIGYTRVEAYETQIEQAPEPLTALIEIGKGGVFALAGAGILAGANVIGNLLKGNATSLMGVIHAITSHYRQHVRVRVWGHRAGLRKNLQALALSIVRGRLEPPNGAAIRPNGFQRAAIQLLTGMEWVIAHDLNGKFVDVQATINRGPASSALLGNASINFPTTDCLFKTNGDQLTTQSRRMGPAYPPPPNSGRTRGTHVRYLIAAGLAMPCTPPSAPREFLLSGDTVTEKPGDAIFPAGPADFT